MRSEVLFGGVIGHPIGHSLSPEIFRILAKGLKQPFAYRPIGVRPADLRSLLETSKRANLFRGLNVTIPHKEAVVRHLDSCSPAALVLKAVNVIHLQGDQLFGHNTDVFGILQTWKERKIPVKGKKIVVWGAGGAALAVGYAAGLQGASEVLFLNRTLARAQKVARRLGGEFPKTQFLAKPLGKQGVQPGAAVYVNATPLGMKGFPAEKFFHNFPSGQKAWAFDLVYRPARTAFLEEASSHGLKTVGGLDMLVWQALEAWKIWFGPLESPQKWKNKLSKRLSEILFSESHSK